VDAFLVIYAFDNLFLLSLFAHNLRIFGYGRLNAIDGKPVRSQTHLIGHLNRLIIALDYIVKI
jgi:hypothetical protein